MAGAEAAPRAIREVLGGTQTTSERGTGGEAAGLGVGEAGKGHRLPKSTLGGLESLSSSTPWFLNLCNKYLGRTR